VTNLVKLAPQISHESISSAIIEEFFNTYNTTCEVKYYALAIEYLLPPNTLLLKVEALDTAKLKVIPSLAGFYENLKNWNWRFGMVQLSFPSTLCFSLYGRGDATL